MRNASAALLRPLLFSPLLERLRAKLQRCRNEPIARRSRRANMTRVEDAPRIGRRWRVSKSRTPRKTDATSSGPASHTTTMVQLTTTTTTMTTTTKSRCRPTTDCVASVCRSVAHESLCAGSRQRLGQRQRQRQRLSQPLSMTTNVDQQDDLWNPRPCSFRSAFVVSTPSPFHRLDSD